MSEKLQWIFELKDRVTGIASKITSSLRATETQLKKLDATSKMRAGFSKLGATLQAARGPINAAGTAIGALGGVVAAVGGGAFGIAAAGATFAIQAASFKRNNLAAFELMLGSADKAKATYEYIKKVADSTPFETEQVVDIYKQLLSAGFDTGSATKVFAAISDIASLQGEKAPEALQSLTEGVQRLMATGKLTGEILEKFNTAGAGAGVGRKQIVEQLAKMRGQSIDQVSHALEQGQIKSNEALRAVALLVQSKGGGQLGKFTETFGSKTLEGQMSTFKSRLKGLFEDVKIQPLIDALTKFNELLSDSTPEGKALRATINGAFADLGASLKAIATPENMKQLLVTAVEVAKAIVDIAKGFSGGFVGALRDMFKPLRDVIVMMGWSEKAGAGMGEAFRVVGRIIGYVVGALIYGVGAIIGAVYVLGVGFYQIALWIGQFFTWLGGLAKSAFDWGAAIVNGLWEGIKATWRAMIEGIKGLVNLLPDAVKKALGIASPSKVMREIGEWTGEGFTLGVQGSVDPNSLSQAMVSPTITAAGLASASSMRASSSQMRMGDVNVTVNAGSTTDPQRLGTEIAATVRREMVSFFDGMAFESGAMGTT